MAVTVRFVVGTRVLQFVERLKSLNARVDEHFERNVESYSAFLVGIAALLIMAIFVMRLGLP